MRNYYENYKKALNIGTDSIDEYLKYLIIFKK